MRTNFTTTTSFAVIASIISIGCLLAFSPPLLADNNTFDLSNFENHPIKSSNTDNHNTELKVGYIEFPPLYITEAAGRPSGELSDIVFGTLDKAGIKYSHQPLPATRLYRNMENGLTDISTGPKGQALYKDNVLFGKHILLYLEQRIYAMGDRPIPSSVDGLMGKHIALKRGYGYGGDFTKLTNDDNLPFVDQVNSFETSLAMLQSGRIDFILGYKHPLSAMISESKIPGIRYRTIKKVPVYFVVSRHTPNAQQIISSLEEHFNPEP